jgi:ABC-type uncharacterized transport system permease subunit
MLPELWHLLTLALAGLCFAAAFALGLTRARRNNEPRAPADPVAPARPDAEGGENVGGAGGKGVSVCFAAGTFLLVLLVGARWAAFTGAAPGSTGPAATTAAATTLRFGFFDYFLVLGLLLAGLAAYFRLTLHLRWLGFFLLPLLALILFVGTVLSAIDPELFTTDSALNRAHLSSVLAGSLCFAAACAGGIMYLLADAQLRRRGPAALRRWRLPALAQIERFLQRAVYLGFPLLTVAMISGVMRAHQGHALKTAWYASPKILLALASWLLYACLLHVRLAPAFRGRRAAWLSIYGFILLLSVFFVVRWLPVE